MPTPPDVIADSSNEAHQLLLKDLGNRPHGIKAASVISNKSPNSVTIFDHDATNSFPPDSGIKVIANEGAQHIRIFQLPLD